MVVSHCDFNSASVVEVEIPAAAGESLNAFFLAMISVVLAPVYCAFTNSTSNAESSGVLALLILFLCTSLAFAMSVLIILILLLHL